MRIVAATLVLINKIFLKKNNKTVPIGVEKGTIHTKRHSGEDPLKSGISKSDSAIKVLQEYSSPRVEKPRNSEDVCTPTTDEVSVCLFVSWSYNQRFYRRMRIYFLWGAQVCLPKNLIYRFLSRIPYQCRNMADILRH